MRALLFLLLCACTSALAQTALPNPDPNAPGAGYTLITKNGQCFWWFVYTDLGSTMPTYCGTPADLPNVGGRVRTIVQAADPLLSLQTLPKRVKTMSTITCRKLVCTTSDPALQPIIAELNAQLAK